MLFRSRRSNQSILKEISPGISLEGMMLKLKLQYFGHLMPRVDSLEKTLMLGRIGRRRCPFSEEKPADNEGGSYMPAEMGQVEPACIGPEV